MDAAQRIFDLLDEIDDKLQSLTDKINDVLSWVPFFLQWAVDKFKDLWNAAMDKLGQLWDKIKEIVANLGQPWRLNDAKDQWAQLGGPVSAKAVEFSRSQSDVDYEWKGRAADRYALALTDQQKALTSVRDKLTSVVAPALGDIANALYLFFGAVAVALAALVVAIVAATAETGSIVGLPAVPVTIAGAVVIALGAIGGACNNLLGSARSANTTFLNLRNADGDFGPRNWPPAVVS
jgi:hypothetical protein